MTLCRIGCACPRLATPWGRSIAEPLREMIREQAGFGQRKCRALTQSSTTPPAETDPPNFGGDYALAVTTVCTAGTQLFPIVARL
jgi:hypothetical protein